ncbi:Mis12 protein-domain-containing protein [Biscogniauxia mediterranea]|nr:Mis12 protein-domain-containing protein [Biscogniauxia mediterranea]
MTTSANSDTELLTEHFGYPPVSLIDDIINSVNILAERALNSVEQGLLNAPPSSLGFKPKSKSKSSQRQKKANNDNGDDDNSAGEAQPAELAKMEIEAGTHQLETLLCASIDRNFDKFEIYVLRNVLCVKPADVRDWMRLSHYEGLDFTTASTSASSSAVTGGGGGDRMDVDADAGAGGAPTLDSINLLRRKLRESMRLNALLTAERARNEKLLSELRGLVGVDAGALARVKSESVSPAASSPAASKTGKRASTSASAANPEAPVVALAENGGDDSPFAFLHRKGDLAGAGGATPLTTTTAFTLSQMQALRALSASLRKLTPDLVVAAAKGQQQQQQQEQQGQQETSESENDEEEKTGEKKQKKKKKSWRRERLEYVEAATRRHLETVQGLELGRHGEVRDGEWQGGGRGLARGEVEGLERVVVGLLGGGGGGDDVLPSTTTTGGGGADDNGTKTTTTTPAAKKTRPPDYSASASASRTRSTRKGTAAAAAASAAAVAGSTSTSSGSGSGSGSGGDADANGENDDDKMDES